MTDTSRQPAGIPTGGQYATGTRDAPSVTLSAPFDVDSTEQAWGDPEITGSDDLAGTDSSTDANPGEAPAAPPSEDDLYWKAQAEYEETLYFSEEEQLKNEAGTYMYPPRPQSPGQVIAFWESLYIDEYTKDRVREAYRQEQVVEQSMKNRVYREIGVRPNELKFAKKKEWDRQKAEIEARVPPTITRYQVEGIIRAARTHWDLEKLSDYPDAAAQADKYWGLDIDEMPELHGPAWVVKFWDLERIRPTIENPSALSEGARENVRYLDNLERVRNARAIANEFEARGY